MNTPIALRHAIANMRLQPILNSVEVWSFGFTGLLLWIVIAPVAHAGLGTLSLLMWVPITCVGMIITHQVRHIAMHWPEMADVEDAMNARAPQPKPAPYDDAVMPEWLARPTRG